MAEAPEEIDNVPPQENPPPNPPNPNNYSFYLKMKPLRTLKLAIETLLDPTLKDTGFGVVGPVTESLVISVTTNDNATAALFLKSADGVIEFRNYVPFLQRVGLYAPLRLISQGFPHNLDGDDDSVIMFHVQETNRLCFEFGTVPPTGFWAQIVEIPHATLFPPFTVLTAATVPVNDMREMIDCTLQTRELVYIDWKPRFAKFQIGSDEKWEYDYSQNDVAEPTGLKNGHFYQAQFNWSYTRWMKEASFLADTVDVQFLTFPEDYVLFKFHIEESADLQLIKKAVLLVVPDMNAEEDA